MPLSVSGDLLVFAKKFGPKMDKGKTQLLLKSKAHRVSGSTLDIEGKQFEMLVTEACTMYLGRLRFLHGIHGTKAKHHMSNARLKITIY